MSAPTLVTDYPGSGWGHTGTAETISNVSESLNDVLVLCAGSADNAQTISSPTGGGHTYTLQQSVIVNQYCAAYQWTTLGTSAQTFNLGLTGSANGSPWSGHVLRFSGSDGVGASAKANASNTLPSLAITTTQANSALVVINLDWTGQSGATRTWRTVNGFTPTAGNGQERVYFTDGSNYTVYIAYYPDVGAVGSKTVGMTLPTAQKTSIIAVEVRGSAAAAATSLPPARRRHIGALLDM